MFLFFVVVVVWLSSKIKRYTHTINHKPLEFIAVAVLLLALKRGGGRINRHC